jgi:methylase of polypeptide subunit release factors
VVADEALAELLRRLDQLGYDFITPTPRTHRKLLRRARSGRASSLRDALGWNLPFGEELLGPELMELLEAADALVADEEGMRCRYRVSRIGSRLFLHSAFPADGTDAVFLGPDTYRFVRFLTREITGAGRSLVDMGAGTGAGGISAAPLLPNASITLVDCNPEALRLARINAAAAGVEVQALEAGSLAAVEDEIDLVIANPPFIVDPERRTYRDGGAMLGAQLSLDWALAAAARLSPAGRMLLYTGSAIVDGQDALLAALRERLPSLGCTLRYEEIDPDIFGELLDGEAYRDVERIAAVGAVIQRLPPSAR